jgi:hypothetical protein
LATTLVYHIPTEQNKVKKRKSDIFALPLTQLMSRFAKYKGE